MDYQECTTADGTVLRHYNDGRITEIRSNGREVLLQPGYRDLPDGDDREPDSTALGSEAYRRD